MAITLALLLNGCGEDSSGESSVDISVYLPANSISKQYTDVVKSNGDLTNNEYTKSILVEPNLITTKQNELLESIVTISDEKVNVILIGDRNRTKIYERNIHIGDEIYSYKSVNKSKELTIGVQRVGEEHIEVVESCILDSKIDKYEFYFYEYKNYDDDHDILKLKCTSIKTVNTTVDADYTNAVAYENGTTVSKENISYTYLQKGIGEVAMIDSDCIIDKSKNIVDDTANKSECIGEQYHYILYHTQY